MANKLESGELVANNVDLAGSRFVNTKLERAVFNDVSLKNALFENVALTGATIRDACMGNVSICDAGYEGMRIEGILVTDLLETYRKSNERNV